MSNPKSGPPESIPMVKGGLSALIRTSISTKPLDNLYERVKCIDDGKGNLGGMNSGVWIVRKKTTGHLFVEKNYQSDDEALIKLFKREIWFLKKLIHCSIIHYADAYVRLKPFEAKVYMEFCDRGDLHSLILRYKDKKKAREPEYVPESFIWHAYMGLSDALYFLKTGKSYVAEPLELDNSKGPWEPIIHRDIKPSNIFLRSRDTPGSKKAFYLVLSDFGMAQTLADTPSQPPYGAYGTPEYHAPELCFDPYPQAYQLQELATPHTSKSDVWALACIIYCLTERDDFAHMDRKCWPRRSPKALGRAAKLSKLHTTETTVYSAYLERTIAWGGNADPAHRPDGAGLIVGIKQQLEAWLADPNWRAQVAVDGRLPEWAAPRTDIS